TKISRAEKASEVAERTKKNCEEAATQGKSLHEMVQTSLNERLNRWATDLQRTFTTINEEILRATAKSGEPHRERLMVQAPLREETPVLPASLLSQVRTNQNTKDVRDILAPFVRTSIVETAMATLNEDWEKEIRPP